LTRNAAPNRAAGIDVLQRSSGDGRRDGAPVGEVGDDEGAAHAALRRCGVRSRPVDGEQEHGGEQRERAAPHPWRGV